MAHAFESGFFVNTPAWHGLGNVIHEAPTVQEGIIQAGLQWDVKLENLFMKDGRSVTHNAVIREDNNKVLGVVGPNWTPLQNLEAFDFFNSFLEEGHVKLESAGSLREGKIVWVLAKLSGAEGEVIKGDKIERYFLLSNGHDGKRAVSMGFTDVRVVCQNTLEMADRSEASKLIRVIHSKQVKHNMKTIKEIVDFGSERFVADMEKMKQLTRRGINQDDVRKFVEAVFFSKADLEKSVRMQNKFGTYMSKINELLETGAGSDIAGVRGTQYGLYNAATEFLTHHITDNDDRRLSQLWFGTTKQLNANALAYLLAA
jgi:phage/plasmid-like protein (TIGR03299 family)